MLLLQTRRHILIIVWILTFVFLYIMKRFKTLELHFRFDIQSYSELFDL